MMSSISLRKDLAEKQSSIEAPGNNVRQLKASGAAAPSEIEAAVQALNALKLEKSSIESHLQSAISGSGGSSSRDAFRQAVINTIEWHLFFIPSFKIYRGVAGLYDYGPPGCTVKSNVLAFWHQHFVLEENMLEVECPCVTPEVGLKELTAMGSSRSSTWPFWIEAKSWFRQLINQLHLPNNDIRPSHL